MPKNVTKILCPSIILLTILSQHAQAQDSVTCEIIDPDEQPTFNTLSQQTSPLIELNLNDNRLFTLAERKRAAKLLTDNLNATDVVYQAQQTPNGHLELLPGDSFWDNSKDATLQLEQRGVAGAVGALNKNKQWQYIGAWHNPDQAIRWPLHFANSGQADIYFKLAIADDSLPLFDIDLGGEVVTCQLPASSKRSLAHYSWKVSFTIAEAGSRILSLAAKTPQSLQVADIYQLDIVGSAVTDASVLKTRFRPKAVHGAFAAKHANKSTFVVTQQQSVAYQGGTYSPITTPFGYYGSSWLSTNGYPTGFNFSLWSFNMKSAYPGMYKLSHMIAVGDKSGYIDTYGHEGTGTKIRGFDPYLNANTNESIQALRMVPAVAGAKPGEAGYYATYYSYYVDHVSRQWRLFAVGRDYDNKLKKDLTIGAFVEVAGAPKTQRTGLLTRDMRYRAWYQDSTTLKWRKYDQLKRTSNINDVANLGWQELDGWFHMTMGGLAHFKYQSRTRNSFINSSSNETTDDMTDLLAQLNDETLLNSLLPADVELLATVVDYDSANLNFNISKLGSNPRVTIHWGTKDALTFESDHRGKNQFGAWLIEGWQHHQIIDPSLLVEGKDISYTLKGLVEGEEYHYRIEIKNDDGLIWSSNTAHFMLAAPEKNLLY